MIRKIPNKNIWKVISHTTGKSLGEYTTLKKAKHRLQQIEIFKHMKGK